MNNKERFAFLRSLRDNATNPKEVECLGWALKLCKKGLDRKIDLQAEKTK